MSSGQGKSSCPRDEETTPAASVLDLCLLTSEAAACVLDCWDC